MLLYYCGINVNISAAAKCIPSVSHPVILPITDVTGAFHCSLHESSRRSSFQRKWPKKEICGIQRYDRTPPARCVLDKASSGVCVCVFSV